MSPKHWGPPIWALFHTMAEKIKEENYTEMYPQIFNWIKQICLNLPCPDCANHASQFLKRVDLKTIRTKAELKMMLFVFHNMVNNKKGYAIYKAEDLDKYREYRLPAVFQIFATSYNMRLGNLKLMSDSMARRQTIIGLSQWFKTNKDMFDN
jgi:hypothetical protein